MFLLSIFRGAEFSRVSRGFTIRGGANPGVSSWIFSASCLISCAPASSWKLAVNLISFFLHKDGLVREYLKCLGRGGSSGNSGKALLL